MTIRQLSEELEGYICDLTEGKAKIQGVKYVDKDWLSKTLRSKNFEGPNGNLVVAYEWKWKWGFKFKEGEGEIEARVSDWEEAEKCTTCNRNIVHIFYVLNKEDNEVRPYGFDHTHKALGIDKELSKSMVTKIKNAVSIPKGQKPLSATDEKRFQQVFRIYQKTADEDLIRAGEKMQKIYGQRPLWSRMPVFFHTVEKKYVFIVGVTDATLKKIEKMIPELKRLSSEEVYRSGWYARVNQQLRFLAKKTREDAVEIFRRGRHVPSEKNIWAVNFKDNLILKIPKNTVLDSDDFPKEFKDWKVGGAELAKQFRERH